MLISHVIILLYNYNILILLLSLLPLLLLKFNKNKIIINNQSIISYRLFKLTNSRKLSEISVRLLPNKFL